MRALKGEERALWREAMRDVRPLHGTARHVRTKVAIKSLDALAKVASTPQPSPIPSPTSGEGSGKAKAEERSGRGADRSRPNLDRRTAQKLRRGQMIIAARLDLHGMTQDEAHRALNRFIAASAAAGSRVLLVITGKSGVLRRMVPLWLDEGENRTRLLSVAPAQAPHGGAGALYVLLRRPR